MPATQAFSSQGSLLKVKISGTFVTIPQCKTNPIPPTDPAFDETTNLDSPSGFPERIVVGKNFVTVQTDIVWIPGNYVHRFLEDASFDQTQLDFEEVVSDTSGATYTFSGYPKWEPKLDTRKAGLVTMTINVTGAVVRTV